MRRSFTLPETLCRFIRSLDTPAPLIQSGPGETWPETEDLQDATATTPPYPPSPAWLASRDAYITHVMVCRQCVTHGPKIPRHCPEGTELQQHYDAATSEEAAK